MTRAANRTAPQIVAQNVIDTTTMVIRPTATGTRLALLLLVLPSVRNSPIDCFKRVLAPSLIGQLADHRAGNPRWPASGTAARQSNQQQASFSAIEARLSATTLSNSQSDHRIKTLARPAAGRLVTIC
jgi:hypothetical protein